MSTPNCHGRALMLLVSTYTCWEMHEYVEVCVEMIDPSNLYDGVYVKGGKHVAFLRPKSVTDV